MIGHWVVGLLGRVETHHAGLEHLRDFVAELDPLYIPPRYPNGRVEGPPPGLHSCPGRSRSRRRGLLSRGGTPRHEGRLAAGRVRHLSLRPGIPECPSVPSLGYVDPVPPPRREPLRSSGKLDNMRTRRRPRVEEFVLP